MPLSDFEKAFATSTVFLLGVLVIMLSLRSFDFSHACLGILGGMLTGAGLVLTLLFISSTK